MVQPVILTVTSPCEPRQDIQVTGSNFGQVVTATFVDPNGVNSIRADFLQIDSGYSAHITVPAAIVVDPTDGSDYIVTLTTVEDETSTNGAGLCHVVAIGTGAGTVVVGAEPVDIPSPLPDPGVSPNTDIIRDRLRLEMADRRSTFEAAVDGTGGWATRYELPVRHIEADSVSARLWNNDTQSGVSLTLNNQYTLDAFEGSVTLSNPLAANETFVLSGTRATFFEQIILDELLHTAFIQLTYGRTITTVAIAPNGYRLYDEVAYTWDLLPEIEWLPVVLMAKINAMWILATDMAYQLDISEDGANVPRTERYRQLMSQITADTLRLHEITKNLNIGLDRIEMQVLRRVSRTTGRLVPIYVEKEYDDYRLPMRVLPGIDNDVDEGETFQDNYYASGGYGGGFAL